MDLLRRMQMTDTSLSVATAAIEIETVMAAEIETATESDETAAARSLAGRPTEIKS